MVGAAEGNPGDRAGHWQLAIEVSTNGRRGRGEAPCQWSMVLLATTLGLERGVPSAAVEFIL